MMNFRIPGQFKLSWIMNIKFKRVLTVKPKNFRMSNSKFLISKQMMTTKFHPLKSKIKILVVVKMKR